MRVERDIPIDASPEDIWEVFWYHGPDKPMTPGVTIEILHPGDDIGNGLVRHCHFPVPKFLGTRGVGQSWEWVTEVKPYESWKYDAIGKPLWSKAEGFITSGYNKVANDPAWRDDAGMKEWRDFMARHIPNGDIEDSSYVTAYNVCTLLVKLLRQCDGDFSRENVMRQVTHLRDVALPIAVSMACVAIARMMLGVGTTFTGTR